MIPQIISQWDKGKEALREYFANTPQSEYDTYKKILTKVFEIAIPEFDDYDKFDVSKLTEIDGGGYNGTLVFIIPTTTYAPRINEYIVTYADYGSCTACDTLQGISWYEVGLPDEKKVSSYMTLALHLVQRMKFLYEE